MRSGRLLASLLIGSSVAVGAQPAPTPVDPPVCTVPLLGGYVPPDQIQLVAGQGAFDDEIQAALNIWTSAECAANLPGTTVGSAPGQDSTVWTVKYEVLPKVVDWSVIRQRP